MEDVRAKFHSFVMNGSVLQIFLILPNNWFFPSQAAHFLFYYHTWSKVSLICDTRETLPNFSNSSLKILLNRQNFQFFIKRQTGVFGILRHCLAKYWSAICQPRLGQWFQMAKPRATTSASDEKIDYFTKI